MTLNLMHRDTPYVVHRPCWLAKMCAAESQYLQSSGRVADYGFQDQATRYGLSIPRSIAEGGGCDMGKKLVQFSHYADRSAADLEIQIFVGVEIGYIDREQGKPWAQETSKIPAVFGS
jgi:four helix bundle protein